MIAGHRGNGILIVREGEISAAMPVLRAKTPQTA